MLFGLMYGQVIIKLFDDFYILLDVLEVFLEVFEGLLDLLLYLIKWQNLDIFDIFVVQIMIQYMEYVELMKVMNLELVVEYLVMVVMLGEIKLCILLLCLVYDEEDEVEDLCVELICCFQEYEWFKQVVEDIDGLLCLEWDFQIVVVCCFEYVCEKVQLDVDLCELLLVFKEVLYWVDMFENYQVLWEKLFIRECMVNVLDCLKGWEFVLFVELFEVSEGWFGVVVSFLVIFELVKGVLIELVQSGFFSFIYVKV